MPARSVFMVRPLGFAPDKETASDNAFQTAEGFEPSVVDRAQLEFDSVVGALQEAGVQVVAVDGHPDHPDDVFPNNWFSTFADGTLVVYPMKAVSRRSEQRPDIIDWLLSRYPQLVDLSGWQDRGMFLEGTGSMVLDHENRLAFAGRSERTNETLFQNWCADFEFDGVMFDTSGPGGKPIYHTNVMLSIGKSFVIVCTECIDNPAHVVSALLSSGREIIEITRSQMMNYCANVLELSGHDDVVVMSSTAHAAYSAEQVSRISSFARPLVVDIPTIERFGGGGARCMLAELH